MRGLLKDRGTTPAKEQPAVPATRWQEIGASARRSRR